MSQTGIPQTIGCWALTLLMGLSFAVSAGAADEDIDDFQMGHGVGNPTQGSVDARGVQMGLPNYFGSGCPQGSMASVLSPDNTQLSLLFDQYIVEAGGGSGERRAQKTCTLDIPLKVPAGFQAAVIKLDYRGYNYLPDRARAKYQVIYSFVDSQSGKRYKRRHRRRMTFRGPLDEEYMMNSVVGDRSLWTECGRDFNLHIETELEARSRADLETSLSTVDSIDAGSREGNVRYHLKWRRCDEGPSRSSRAAREDRQTAREDRKNARRDRDRERDRGRLERSRSRQDRSRDRRP